MGQYYIIANLDKKQFIDPHSFGDGAKFIEFGLSGSGTMSALAVLLADGIGRGGGDIYSDNHIIGSWAGDRIVIAGDYADDEKFTPDGCNLYGHITKFKTGKKIKVPYEVNLIDETITNPEWTDVSDNAMAAMMDDMCLAKDIREKIIASNRPDLSELIKLIDAMKFDDALKYIDDRTKNGYFVGIGAVTYIKALMIRTGHVSKH